MSCFEVKPRRRRGVDDSERKAFRLCVNADDCDRLLDATVWPDSVLISEWHFKAQSEDKRRRVDAEPNPETSRVDNRSVVAVLHDENDDTIIVSNMDCQSDDQQQPS